MPIMEKIQAINPQRIAWCCADYGMTTDALACEVNMAASTMQQFMAGKTGLTFSQLRKIAEYFGRGTLFFLEPEPVIESQVHTVQFRTLTNQKPTLSLPA
jgi:transcriptional regulator with XRE-family HTH domain